MKNVMDYPKYPIIFMQQDDDWVRNDSFFTRTVSIKVGFSPFKKIFFVSMIALKKY